MNEANPVATPAEVARRLNDNRSRVLAGEDISPAEYKEIIDQMRSIRLAAAQADLKRPKAAKKPAVAVNLEDLL